MRNLDLLRSVAIALVVLDHTLLSKGHELWHGWLIGDVGLFGVYLFFLHTSLVLMGSLERRPNTLDFYIRRSFRIYPLAVVAILIAAVTHAPVAGIPFHYFRAVAVNRRALFYNLLLIFDLKPAQPAIHGVTWSLPPEIYMYILLPALFVYARAVRKVWPLLVIWVLVVCCDSHFFPDRIVGNNFLLLVALFVGYMFHHEIRADWIACLVIALVLPSIRELQGDLLARVLRMIARYSYGLYLFHPFSIVLGMYLLAGRSLVLQLGVEFVSLAAFAFVGYHIIEAPLIRLGARVAARLAGEQGLPSEESLETLEPAP